MVDVETNGLSDRRHRLLQMAVVTVDADGAVLDRWDTFVRPRFGRVGPTHIHGLTAVELRRRRPSPTWPPSCSGASTAPSSPPTTPSSTGGSSPRSLQRAGYRPPDTARLCTMRLSRALAVEPTSHRLVDVCGRHGITITRAHDALADAEATAAVLPLLLAAGQVTSADDLVPHLTGASSEAPWPAWTAPPWWRRALYG